MTTVYDFSEMNGVTLWAGIVARRCEIGSLDIAMAITAGEVPVRFATDVAPVVDDAVSATSTQGPQ